MAVCTQQRLHLSFTLHLSDRLEPEAVGCRLTELDLLAVKLGQAQALRDSDAADVERCRGLVELTLLIDAHRRGACAQQNKTKNAEQVDESLRTG